MSRRKQFTFSDLPQELIQRILYFQPYLEIKIAESYKYFDNILYKTNIKTKVSLFFEIFARKKNIKKENITSKLIMIYPNIKICKFYLENSIDEIYFLNYYKLLMNDLFFKVTFIKLNILKFNFNSKSFLNNFRFLNETFIKRNSLFGKELESIYLHKLPLRENTYNYFFNFFTNQEYKYGISIFKDTIKSQQLRSLIKSICFHEKTIQEREQIFQLFTFFPNIKHLTFVIENNNEKLDDLIKLFKKYLPKIYSIEIRGGYHTHYSITNLLKEFKFLRNLVIYLNDKIYKNNHQFDSSNSFGLGVPHLQELNKKISKLKSIKIIPQPCSNLSIVFDKESLLKQIIQTGIKYLKGDFMLIGGSEKLLLQSNIYKLMLTKSNFITLAGKFDFLKILTQMKSLRELVIHEGLLHWRPTKYFKPTLDSFLDLFKEYELNNFAFEKKFKIYCKKEKSPLKKLLIENKNIYSIVIKYKTIEMIELEKFKDNNLTLLEKKIVKLFECYIRKRFYHLQHFKMKPVI
ncbi:hypothetical protein ABK040_009774 [Willaertia magna]